MMDVKTIVTGTTAIMATGVVMHTCMGQTAVMQNTKHAAIRKKTANAAAKLRAAAKTNVVLLRAIIHTVVLATTKIAAVGVTFIALTKTMTMTINNYHYNTL